MRIGAARAPTPSASTRPRTARPDAPDRIEDFAQGEDRVDVSRLAGSDGPGFAWLDGGAFTASGDPEARQEAHGGSTLLLLDTDGDGAADAALVLANDVRLTSSDIVL